MAVRDYVIQTHPCSEVRARANLEARDFAVFLPTVVFEGRTGPLREKRYTTVEPLFPGYLFVTMDLARDAWRKISVVREVRGILGADAEHPTPLPVGALQDLQARFAAGEFVRRVSSCAVRAGDWVTVGSGAFQGHTGVCTVSRGERVRVMLTKLWGAVEVEMPASLVMAGAR